MIIIGYWQLLQWDSDVTSGMRRGRINVTPVNRVLHRLLLWQGLLGAIGLLVLLSMAMGSVNVCFVHVRLPNRNSIRQATYSAMTVVISPPSS